MSTDGPFPKTATTTGLALLASRNSRSLHQEQPGVAGWMFIITFLLLFVNNKKIVISE